MAKRQKLTAEDGMYLSNGKVSGKEVYPGSLDSIENWEQVQEEDNRLLHTVPLIIL